MASARLLAVSRTITIALLTLLLAPAAAQTPPAPAPAPLVFPEGLPEWAFNIPDPVQPPTPPIAGIVRVPGSAREYDAAAIAGNTIPPTGSRRSIRRRRESWRVRRRTRAARAI